MPELLSAHCTKTNRDKRRIFSQVGLRDKMRKITTLVSIWIGLVLIYTLTAAQSAVKSKGSTCVFLKKEKNEIVDLKKPGISKKEEEIKLSDGATATIKQEVSGSVDLSIQVGAESTEIKTKNPSLNVLTLKTASAVYELQCAL